MSKKVRLIKHQTLRNNDGHTSEGSAYWDHAEKFGRRTEEGTILENKLANPDVLADDPKNTLWGTGSKPELAELIIERFADATGNFPILSKVENKILSLYLQCGDVKYITTKLKLTRSSCNTYLARIRRKFKRLLLVLNY